MRSLAWPCYSSRAFQSADPCRRSNRKVGQPARRSCPIPCTPSTNGRLGRGVRGSTNGRPQGSSSEELELEAGGSDDFCAV
jgi:hypothetical protein